MDHPLFLFNKDELGEDMENNIQKINIVWNMERNNQN